MDAVAGGTKPVSEKVEKIIQGLDATNDGLISRIEFAKYCHRYHNILLPAFSLQHTVRERVFGSAVHDWHAVETRRRKVVGGRSIVEIIQELAPLLPSKRSTSTADDEPAATDVGRDAVALSKDTKIDEAAERYRVGDFAGARAHYEAAMNMKDGSHHAVTVDEAGKTRTVKNAAMNRLQLDAARNIDTTGAHLTNALPRPGAGVAAKQG